MEQKTTKCNILDIRLVSQIKTYGKTKMEKKNSQTIQFISRFGISEKQNSLNRVLSTAYPKVKQFNVSNFNEHNVYFLIKFKCKFYN